MDLNGKEPTDNRKHIIENAQGYSEQMRSYQLLACPASITPLSFCCRASIISSAKEKLSEAQDRKLYRVLSFLYFRFFRFLDVAIFLFFEKKNGRVKCADT